jgi:hypothetical protein
VIVRPSHLAADGEHTGWWSWLQGHSSLLVWLFVLSIGSLVVTALLLPVVVRRLPPDYFTATRRELASQRSLLQWTGHVAKNALGMVFVLAGIAMLVLPGQGLLTILIGLLLVDFPGKRALERHFVRRRGVLEFLNRMRARHGRPPLQVD